MDGTDESPGATGPLRARAGGRSERVRRAVGDAVLALLAEGRVSFTVVEVAERAGVSRRTVYRWWPTHDDLLREALSRHVRRVPVPDTGSWAGDVRAFAHRLAEFAADPVEVATAAVLAGREHPDFSRLLVDQYQPVLDAWRAMVERAVARGEATPQHRPETVVSALASPLLLAPLMLGRPVPAADVDALVALVLAATTP